MARAGSGWRRVLGVLVVASLVVGVGGGLIVALRSAGLQAAANWAQLVSVALAVAPLIAAVVVWWRHPRRHPPLASAAEQVDGAQRTLASLVLRQWREEILRWQLDDPAPLAVHWRLTELDVTDHAAHIVGWVPPGRARLRYHGRSDRVGDMVAHFRRLAMRRLVILGAAGMGKTTLAVLLLRELLERPEAGDPVPVLLSLSGWHPDRESLPEWLTRQLDQTYPALRAADFGPDACQALVSQRRILPVLDGLDELPVAVRPRVLTALNSSMTAADPLILTCRTEAYHAAVTATTGDVVTGAAVIEPEQLTATDAAAYLRRCLPPRPGGRWPDLLAALMTSHDLPVVRALSTPLALWLVRKVYVDAHTDPGTLLDPARFPTATAVTDHLLDHLVPAVVSANAPRRDADHDHPFRPRHAWEPGDATRWLGFLAHHLRTTGSRDFAWWRLPHAVPGRLWKQYWTQPREPAYVNVRLRGRIGHLVHELRWLTIVPVAALVIALLFGFIGALPGEGARHPEGGLDAAVQFGSTMGLVFGIAGLVCAVVVGLVRWSTAPVADDHPQTPTGTLRNDLRLVCVRALLVGAAVGLIGGIAIGVAEWVRAGPLSGLYGFLLVGLLTFAGGLGIGLLVLGLLGTASGAYLVTVAALRARGRLPLRLMAFLDDAHRLGLLHQAGAIYHFRHARLQDRLADAYRRQVER